MSHPKTPADARAEVPRLRKPSTIVAYLRALLVALPQSPKWASSPGVQAAAAGLTAATDALDTNEQEIAALLQQLALRRLAVLGLVRHAYLAASQVVAAVNGVVDGTVADVVAFGFKGPVALQKATSTDAPQGLRARLGKVPGVGIWEWAPVRNQHGYVVEHTLDATLATGWTAQPSTRASFQLTGVAPAQKVFVRVAVIRTNGQSVWSEALGLVVR